MWVAVTILALPIAEPVPGRFLAVLQTLDRVALLARNRFVGTRESITRLLFVIELLEFETGGAVAVFARPKGFAEAKLSGVSIFMTALTLARHAPIGSPGSLLSVLG